MEPTAGCGGGRALSRRSPTPFDSLPDDVWKNILWHCNFSSAVALSGTCRSIRNRLLIDEDNLDCVATTIWRTLYHRHGFCPPTTPPSPETNALHHTQQSNPKLYQTLCLEKRKLLWNLLGRRHCKAKTARSCPFTLPNRHFYFLPIVPTLEEDGDEDYPNVVWDPPPVFWECDSFVLTDCGTGGELLLLDPFDGSLRVVNCLQHNMVASYEAMMELALTSAAKALLQYHHKHDNKSISNNGGDDEAHIAGTAIDETIQSNHSRHEQRPPINQCLLPGDEAFDLDVTDFFLHLSVEQLTAQEFEIHHAGIDAKTVWNYDVDRNFLQKQGTVVVVGRCVESLDDGGLLCTEVSTWTRWNGEAMFGHRRRCRLPHAFRCADIDPYQQRIFCSFHPGQGPNGAKDSTIAIYPLVEDNDKGTSCNYFAPRVMSISCQHPISSLVLDAAGKILVVATMKGTLECWNVSGREDASRQDSFSVLRKLRSSIQLELTRRTTSDEGQKRRKKSSRGPSPSSPHDENHDDEDAETPSRFAVLRRQPDLAQFHAPTQDIFVPRHLPVEISGFVTLHYSRDEGSSLLVWKLLGKGKGEWEIVSLIHLRLTVRRKPRVYYDGNRIIVFGEDHIGPIVLVYQVRGTETAGSFSDAASSSSSFAMPDSGDASGGVYHLMQPHYVRFANRIRHVALGGIETMDSIHMTCNERFLILNTRTGNHLGSSPFSEGLLIIDLEDHH